MGRCQAAGKKKKRGRGCAISKRHHFLAQLLERSKRAKKIGDSFDFPNRTELVGGGRKAWNIPSTPTTHSETTRCPSTWLHTHTTTTTTHKDFARNKKKPANVKHTVSISGLVVEYIVAIDVTRVRFLADAICPILHLCTRTLGKNKTSIENPSTPSHNIALYENSPRPGIEPGSSA